MFLSFFCPAHVFWLCACAQPLIAFPKCYNFCFALLVRIIVYSWIFLIDVLNFMCSYSSDLLLCQVLVHQLLFPVFLHFIMFCFFSILCCFFVLLCYPSNFRIISAGVDGCFLRSHVLGVRTCNYIIPIISSWYGSHDYNFHVRILDLVIYIQQ